MALQKQPITKEITNFSGRLTRIVNGDLNSGFANFTKSYGYDPFTKPMNLTWLEASGNISGVSDLVLDGKTRFIGESFPSAYLIGSTGNLYKIQINSSSSPAVNSVVGVFSVKSGNPSYNKGASLEFFGNETKVYVGSDSQVNSINLDGTADAVVGTGSNYQANVFRPLKNFIGKLMFGNGVTVGAIGVTGTVTSSVIGVSSAVSLYSELNPPLPNTTRVRGLDVSTDNTYLLIAGSDIDYPNIAQGTTPNLQYTIPSDSKIYFWNGTNTAITSANTLSTSQLVSFKTYLEKNYFFTSDSFGSAVNKDNQKLFTLVNNQPPLPNSIGVNGNFLFWSTAEKETTESGTVRTVHSMYYFGSLDAENPAGLYRVLRQPALVFGGNVLHVPFNKLVETHYEDLNITQSSVQTIGYGTHYFSSHEANTTDSVLALRYFNMPPTGTRSSSGGIYQTQTQLFSKRIGIVQIRLYTEPMASGTSVQLDCIGTDGEIMENGTFTWNYGDTADPQSGSLAVERINFNPNMKSQYGLGLRITCGSSVNFTIKKIEVDYTEEGK